MKRTIVAGIAALASSMAIAQQSEFFIQAGQTLSPSTGSGVIGAGAGFVLPWSFKEGLVVSRLDLSLVGVDAKKGDVLLLSAVPILRYQPQSIGFFVEGGIGLGYVSRTVWERRHDLGGRLHFASRLGVGYDFGAYALSVNVSHISNADLKKPNDGADMLDIRLSRGF